MATVTLEKVSKLYAGGVWAVESVDLAIGDGEFVVLVGPSGCGKSTTLRMIAGLEEISQGTIRIGDRVVNDVPAKDRDIAMVFQSYALYPHMSVRKNLAFGLKLRGVDRGEIARRVGWAAEVLGLEGLMDRKPRALSGGQRQRVAVGRAIVRQPRAFLFDEPLSNLDAKLRVETRSELKRLHQRLGTTTVYVTHDQEEAMTLGQRVVVMDGGRVQQADDPLSVYRRPANRFVAGFLGTPPMNFIEGRLMAGSDDRSVRFECVGGGGAARLELVLSPGRRTDGLTARIGEQIVLGIRPESLRLRRLGQTDQPVTVGVDVVEPLGSHIDLLCTLGAVEREGVKGMSASGPEKNGLREVGAGRMVARVSASEPPAPGQSLELWFDPAEAHLFEPGTHGSNLTL